MPAKIALFRGSFNPPGIHHRLVVEALVPHFDKIVVLPCGPRPDQLTINDVDPSHRASLLDIAFQKLPKAKVEVDLSDIEFANYATYDELEARHSHLGELWHVIGTDIFECSDASSASASWMDAEPDNKMQSELNFCVVAPHGREIKAGELPPKHFIVQLTEPSSATSSEIREKIFKRQPYTALVTP